MDSSTERQFQEADAAVDQAVAAFISEIKSMSGKWEAVAPAYIVERVLLALCDELTKLIDDPDIANSIGTADPEAVPCAGRIPGFATGGALSVRNTS